MKALYLTNKPIYPKIDGGCVAMDNFLKCLLQSGVEVKHICISTNKHPFDLNAYPKEYQSKLGVVNHHIDTDVTPIRAIKGLFESGSYNINRFNSTKLQDRIELELEQSDVDFVILESLFTATYINPIRFKSKARVFMRTHNIEHKITSDLAKNASGLKKMYLSKLAKDLKEYELDALKKVDGILSISKDDTNKIKALGIKTPIRTIGVAIPQAEIDNKYEGNSIFHLGSMNWQPNVEAVERLISLFPSIRELAPECELHIAGSSDSKAFKSKSKDNIFVDGYIDDINSFAISHGILVSPIISGSGVRIKILEMMAIGIPVVTTKLGASGIDYNTSKCLLSAESNEELIDSTVQLVQNKELRKEIGQNAIAYIRKNHNIESISTEIIEFIQGT